MKFYQKLLLLGLLLLGSPCQGSDGNIKFEQIKDKIYAPKINPVFIFKLDKSMLETQPLKVAGNVKEINYSNLSDDEIKDIISKQPLKSDAYIELSRRLDKNENYQQRNQVLNIALQRILSELDKNSEQWELIEEAIKVYQYAQQPMKSKQLLETFIEDNPDNVDALLTLANLNTLYGNFGKARIGINKAYDKSPERVEVYISEFLYQLYRGIKKLNETVKRSERISMPISTEFLDKAILEHPSQETPEKIKHSLMILQIFYTELFENIELFKQNRIVEFAIEQQKYTSLTNSKNYLLKQLSEHKNEHFLEHLLLLMVSIIENNQKSAQQYFDILVTQKNSNNSIYRLMMINFLAKQQLLKAIEVLRNSINNDDNLEDRLILANLYHKIGKTDTSLRLIKEYQGMHTLEALINQMAYALLLDDRKNAWILYEHLKELNASWQSKEFIYYSAIVVLLKGEKKLALDYLGRLPVESDYYQSLENIILLISK